MKKPPKTKKPAKKKAAPKPRPKSNSKSRSKPKPVPVASVVARLVEGPIPYLEVTVREKVTEDSMVRLFEYVQGEVARLSSKRVLIDVRGGSIALTISDMLGLAKMVAAAFASVLERFALLLRPQDVLAEKFFEPSVNSRGLPTFVTTDPDEATYWISAKLRPGR